MALKCKSTLNGVEYLGFSMQLSYYHNNARLSNKLILRNITEDTRAGELMGLFDDEPVDIDVPVIEGTDKNKR